MPRSKEAKTATHERIVTSAGRLIRRRGIAAASVGQVMRGAGLTVGGFYAHFRSKQAMDAEVLRTLLGDAARKWFQHATAEGAIQAGVKRYLSPKHRDASDTGCPLPAVLSELTRAPKSTRQAFVDSIEIYVEEFAKHDVGPSETSRERALATLATCVGGLTLARGLREDPLSDEMLDACVKSALR